MTDEQLEFESAREKIREVFAANRGKIVTEWTRQHQLLYENLRDNRGMTPKDAARYAIVIQPGYDVWLKEQQRPTVNWWGWIVVLKIVRVLAILAR